MKAYVRTAANTQEAILSDVPTPKIAPDEVLIKVESFGVGIHDRYFIPQDAQFPYVLGSEGAGTIAQLGSTVTGHNVGDRVIFKTVLQPQGGCWAEMTTTKAAGLVPLPDALSFAQGASIPIASGTALECMRCLGLKSGDTLFIAGASGAIGTIVIQLAKAQGIRVAGSASPSNHDLMRSLGADLTVDYNDPNWQAQVKEWSGGGVDGALAIQPGTGTPCLPAVKDGGKLITVSGDSATVALERGIAVSQMDHSMETQQKLVELVASMARGEVKIVIEKEYPFDQALEALGKTETRHARGKLVVSGCS